MGDRVRALFDNRILRIVILTVLSLLAARSVYQGIANARVYSQDFQWDAARALMLGIDPYRESLSPTGALSTGNLPEFYDYYESIDAPQKMEANQFPSLLMLLYPWAMLAPGTARLVWLFTNLLFTAGIIVLLRLTFLKDCDRYWFCVLALLMLAGTPYRNQLGVGQHTLFSLCFFLLAVWLANRKHGSIPSALCLAVGVFKYTLTAPLALYFVWKKKWKELAIAVLIHVVLTVVAALLLREPVTDMILLPMKVSSALASEGGLDFGALLGGSPLAFVLAGLVFALLFVLALFTRQEDGNALMAVLLLWSLIMLYHRTYDFFPLILVAGMFTGDLQETYGRDRILFGGFMILLLCVFFVLRLFHENTASRIIVGALYYAYTVYATIILIEHTGFGKHETTGKA